MSGARTGAHDRHPGRMQVIFTDDLVVRGSRIGIVERAPNSSDEDSGGDDEIEVIADNSAGGKLAPGSAHVRWRQHDSALDAGVRTEFTSELQLADRVFLLGDILTRASNQLGQTGIVVGMRMFCELHASDGSPLGRAPTTLLQPLAACRPGTLVLHRRALWLGRVDEVYDNVQISFDDGASCKILRTAANTLAVHSSTMDEQTWFWPAMRVSAVRRSPAHCLRRSHRKLGAPRMPHPSASLPLPLPHPSLSLTLLPSSDCPRQTRDVLRRAKWLKGSFRSAYVGEQATVVRVQAAQALIRWLAATPTSDADANIDPTPPPEMQRPSRLVELREHHARACWRLGEHAALLPADYDALVAGRAETEGTAAATRKKARKSPVDVCVEVRACHTRVDVIWQDGTTTNDAPATTFSPAKHVDGYYEFWPQDFVVGKTAETGSPAPVGLVESVDHDQRLCVVTWRDGSEREVVPVFDVAPHPDFNFKVGDTVLRLPPPAAPGPAVGDDAPALAVAVAAPAAAGSAVTLEAAAATASAATASAATASAAANGGAAAAAEAAQLTAAAASPAPARATEGDGKPAEWWAAGSRRGDLIAPAPQEEEEEGGEEDEEGVGVDRIAWVGEVQAVGLRLRVRWMDGSVSEVPPEELYVVNTDEDDEAIEDDGSYDEEEGGRSDDDGSSGWETVTGDEGDEDGVMAGRSTADGAEDGDSKDADADGVDDEEEAYDTAEEDDEGEGARAREEAVREAAAKASMQRRVKTLFDHLVATGAAPNDAAARALASAQAEIDGVERPPASAPTASTRAPTAAEPVATTPNAASSPSATLPGALAEAVGGSQSDDEAEAAYGAHAQFWVEDDADPEGHYYASQGASAPAPTAQFTRTVRKQWQLLQAGLPRGIHVAAYAGRVDLLRALVLGPPATPYVDAVFVFDIQLPPDFPQQPPSVHYVSHGERVNPNLYENGKVCLSLLGTWTGRQSCELWNPEESTVLQVRRPRRS